MKLETAARKDVHIAFPLKTDKSSVKRRPGDADPGADLSLRIDGIRLEMAIYQHFKHFLISNIIKVTFFHGYQLLCRLKITI